MNKSVKILGIVTIILILGAIGFVYIGSKNLKKPATTVKSNVENQISNQQQNDYKSKLLAIVQAAEQYYADKQEFPASISTLVGRGSVTSQTIIDPATDTFFQLVVDSSKKSVRACTSKENTTKICMPQDQ